MYKVRSQKPIDCYGNFVLYMVRFMAIFQGSITAYPTENLPEHEVPLPIFLFFLFQICKKGLISLHYHFIPANL